MKNKFVKLHQLGLAIYALLNIYFIWAALLAFVLGVTAAGGLAVVWPLDTFVCQLDWRLLFAALAGLTGFLLLLALIRNRPVWLLPVFLLLGLVWSLLAQARLASFAPLPGEAVFFQGRVAEVIERGESPLSALLGSDTSVGDESFTFIIQGRDQNGWQGRLMVVGSPVRPKVGDRLEICGLVQKMNQTYNFELTENPYFYNQSIAAMVRPVPEGISFQGLASPLSPLNLAETLRQRLFRMMELLPQRQQALLRGIGFGDMDMLTNGQQGILGQTGIMHIFAVSGLHIGYVVLLGGWLFGRLKIPDWLRLAFTACLVLFFALVAGLTASVIRAVIMTLLGGLGVWLNKGRLDRRSSVCWLVLAAFLLLLWRPNWALQPGFLLSFLATAGILCTTLYWRQLIPFNLLSVSFAAQFMIMPVVAYFFNIVSLVGLLASPFLACAAGLVVIFLLLAMPLALLLPGAAYVPLAGAGLLADWLYQGAEWLASLPLAYHYVLRPGWLELLLYYLLLGLGMYLLKKSHNFNK